MFWVTNKDRLVSVGIALSTVLVLFLLAATFKTQNIGTSIQTSAKTSKMLPIYNVDTEENKVALTINCAWNADDIDLILGTLTKNQVKATFFMVGNKMASQKDIVKKVYHSNSEIGYHSYNHTLFTKNKNKKIESDFDKTNKIYYDITGDYLSLTRPPYGAYNNRILKALNTSFILWDKDTHDWKYKDTDFIVKYVLENANDKDIILFHDSYKTTVEAVKKLIDILYENDIKVLSVTNYAKENNIKLENKVYYSFK